MTLERQTAESPVRVLAAILAGGRGARMGGRDKGLIAYGGKPLIRHVLDGLAPQIGAIVINANRNLAVYQRFGYPVIEDGDDRFAGPLAGMLAVMTAVPAERYLFVPCDTPELPRDLLHRLSRALDAGTGQVACAADDTGLHPVIALVRAELRDEIASYLAAGQRRVVPLFERFGLVQVRWPDQPQAFMNINAPEDLGDSHL